MIPSKVCTFAGLFLFYIFSYICATCLCILLIHIISSICKQIGIHFNQSKNTVIDDIM